VTEQTLTPQTRTAHESLNGTIERVTYHNEESGFCVLRLKVKNNRDLVTVVGSAMTVTPGEFVDCQGEWINDRQYGLQFRAEKMRLVLPSTLEGIEKYLGSGLVKGVGPHFAKCMVKAFGEKVFEVIDKTPERLTELPGIGPSRRAKIIQSWGDQKTIREIVVFLQSHGIGTARAVRIYKTYGQSAIQKVSENPYRLALDIRGIGFKTADTLAEKLNIPRDSPMRAQAGVRHLLQDFASEGHSAVIKTQLIEDASLLLEITEDIIEEAIQLEIDESAVIPETIENVTYLFLGSFYHAEVGIVEHLNRLLKPPIPAWQKEIKIEEAIKFSENKTRRILSPTQREALRVILQNKVVLVTGGPGVGKTTLVNSLLTIVFRYTSKVVLCAPTGRAAKRLNESTGVEAKTLHRLLEFDPSQFLFKRDEYSPLEADVLVVDEMSMVDLVLMYRLLKAVPSHCVLLLVGDADQLPSVGPGMVLSNLIDSETLACVRLTEIFRQAKTSQIIVNAHQINKGHLPKLDYETGILSDFYFIEAKTPEAILEKLMQVVTVRIPKRFGLNPIRDIQVLVPMNRGGLGARALNIALQKQLNPKPSASITRYGWTFSVNDKVIQNVNNYDKEVFNGDIGVIRSIDEEEGLIIIQFDDRKVNYEIDDLDELSLAYATSIHKAQGSEYPAIVIPIAMQHFKLLDRKLLYTGVTRGKSLVVLIGEVRAIAMAVRTERSGKRVTNLKRRLVDHLKNDYLI